MRRLRKRPRSAERSLRSVQPNINRATGRRRLQGATEKFVTEIFVDDTVNATIVRPEIEDESAAFALLYRIVLFIAVGVAVLVIAATAGICLHLKTASHERAANRYNRVAKMNFLYQEAVSQALEEREDLEAAADVLRAGGSVFAIAGLGLLVIAASFVVLQYVLANYTLVQTLLAGTSPTEGDITGVFATLCSLTLPLSHPSCAGESVAFRAAFELSDVHVRITRVERSTLLDMLADLSALGGSAIEIGCQMLLVFVALLHLAQRNPRLAKYLARPEAAAAPCDWTSSASAVSDHLGSLASEPRARAVVVADVGDGIELQLARAGARQRRMSWVARAHAYLRRASVSSACEDGEAPAPGPRGRESSNALELPPIDAPASLSKLSHFLERQAVAIGDPEPRPVHIAPLWADREAADAALKMQPPPCQSQAGAAPFDPTSKAAPISNM
eukprot:tig00000767_g3966.t1